MRAELRYRSLRVLLRFGIGTFTPLIRSPRFLSYLCFKLTCRGFFSVALVAHESMLRRFSDSGADRLKEIRVTKFESNCGTPKKTDALSKTLAFMSTRSASEDLCRTRIFLVDGPGTDEDCPLPHLAKDAKRVAVFAPGATFLNETTGDVLYVNGENAELLLNREPKTLDFLSRRWSTIRVKPSPSRTLPLAGKSPAQIQEFDSPTHLFFAGKPLMLVNVIWDLFQNHSADLVLLRGFDLYTRPVSYRVDHRKKNESGEIVNGQGMPHTGNLERSQSLAYHSVFENYDVLGLFRRTLPVVGNPAFEHALSLGKEKYALQLDKALGVGRH